MNKVERVKMVKAMEFIVRQVNDEENINVWFTNGVADGDIEYGDFFTETADLEEMEDYTEDEEFSYLMAMFLYCMKNAYFDGGLYCDGILSE